MFGCMISECPAVFSSPREYVTHLREFHRVPREYVYRCTFPRCFQKTTNWYIFKRHVLQHDKSATDHPSSVNQDAVAEVEVEVPEEDAPFPKIREINPIKENIDPKLSEIQQIDNQAVNFTLSLHSRNNLTRTDVRSIQKSVDQVNSHIALQIAKLPLNIPDPQIEYQLHTYLEKMQNMFVFIDTDYKFFKYLTEASLFSSPSVISVVKQGVLIQNNDDPIIDESKSYVVVMQLRFQIEEFFKCEHVLTETIENTKRLEQSKVIKSVVNGKAWQEVRLKYGSECLIPISVYADEYEINDCLSSHNKKHVICGIYYSFPTVPVQYSSRLCNIFVAAMIKKVDINEFGVNNLFGHVINQFKELEMNPISFNTFEDIKTVRFVVAIFQGDNLGLHSLQMFMAFGANYYCRFCRRPKHLLQTDCEEHLSDLRNEENYNTDVALNNPPETGVKCSSVFNTLPSYHVTKNLSVDPMHDLFSGGICITGIEEILNHCIYKKHFLTLSMLNAHKNQFSKQVYNASLKRMPDISETFSSTKKCKTVSIRATASEAKAFLHFFTLIVGPFVPENDEVWKYCKTLIQLVDIILSQTLTENDIEQLRKLVTLHHKQYQQLFEQKLKPKHHFLNHYGTVAEQNGILVSMMNFRYEAKHKTFKEYARVISSRRNICYTLCIKAALQFAYNVQNGMFFKSTENNNFSPCILQNRPYISQVPQPMSFDASMDTLVSKQIKNFGTIYKEGMYLTLTEIKSVQLFEIIEFLLVEEVIYIVGEQWLVGGFIDHYLAYEAISKMSIVKIIRLSEFDGPPVSVHNIMNKLLFRKSQDFSSMDTETD